MRLLELGVQGEPTRGVRKSWSTDALAYIVIVCVRITFPLHTHMQHKKARERWPTVSTSSSSQFGTNLPWTHSERVFERVARPQMLKGRDSYPGQITREILLAPRGKKG